MTEQEMIDRARRAVEDFNALPVDEQWRRMIEWGLINEQGEVLWNLEYARQVEEAVRKNGAAGAKGTPE
jgi:hypothetical protein